MFLTSLIFLPILAAGLILVTPKKWTWIISTVFSLVYFLWSLNLFYFFNPDQIGFQLIEKIKWFPRLGIHYFVGIDGISFWMVLLTSFLLPITILSSKADLKNHVQGFLACLMTLTGFVMGSFLSLDACLFYIFFEGSLLPLFFLILIWGGEKRVYASYKFFIYTALGSLFMLAGIGTLIFLVRSQIGFLSASLFDFYQLEIPFVGNYILSYQSLLFFTFFIAFAIKAPLFPFHTWLPLAHVEAPTSASVFLAAIVLKMGAYGFLRFILPLFPEASLHYAPFVCFLSVIGIIYGAMMALSQKDLKKLVAYSSVSHMGYVVLGFFVFNTYALYGGVFQMITHGLSSAGLFLMVGMIYERTKTRQIEDYGGLASQMPIYATLFFLICLSAIAFPLTGGFISEFLILFGSFLVAKKWAALACLGVILGAAYILYMIHRVFFGPSKKGLLVLDLKPREIIILIPIILIIFVSGIFPNIFIKYSKTSLSYLLNERFNYDLSQEELYLKKDR